MAVRGLAAVAAAVLLAATGCVSAQSVRDVGPPAELPPADFQGIQYVDSRGCVYIRAGVGGVTNWVPRVNRDREVLCGFQPTFVEAPPPASPTPPRGASGGAVDLTAGPTGPSEAEPQAEAAARQPTAGGGRRPIEAVASIATPPRTARSTAAVPVEVPAERRPRRITLAEACEGRSGIRGGLIDTRTGQPLDCGPAEVQTVAAPAPIQAPVPRRITLAEACDGRTGVQQGLIDSRTDQPLDCGRAQVETVAVPVVVPEPSGPRRVARAEICAEMAATGRRFINQATGLPVRCAPIPVPPATMVAEAAPVPQTRTVAAVSGSCPGELGRIALSDLPARCGSEAVPPLAGVRLAAVEQSRVSTRSAADLRPFAPRIPASNPAFVRTIDPEPPAGYERVWNDGRLNPQRGIVGSAAPA